MTFTGLVTNTTHDLCYRSCGESVDLGRRGMSDVTRWDKLNSDVA